MKRHRESGQGLVEYALILALVSIVVIGILVLLGPATGNVFSMVNNCLRRQSQNCSTSVGSSGGNTLTISAASGPPNRQLQVHVYYNGTDVSSSASISSNAGGCSYNPGHAAVWCGPGTTGSTATLTASYNGLTATYSGIWP